MSTPKTLKFKSASALYAEVMNLVEAGKADLFQGMFVSYENELCQIVLLGKLPFFEYYLIDVQTINDLNASMDFLSSEGWEPYGNTVLYRGNYLQWMSRLKSYAVNKYAEVESFEIPSDLQMVEGVQPVKLVVGDGLFSTWRNPFVVNQLNDTQKIAQGSDF